MSFFNHSIHRKSDKFAQNCLDYGSTPKECFTCSVLGQSIWVILVLLSVRARLCLEIDSTGFVLVMYYIKCLSDSGEKVHKEEHVLVGGKIDALSIFTIMDTSCG